MVLKRGIDQTSAVMIGIVGAAIFLGILYGILLLLGGHHKDSPTADDAGADAKSQNESVAGADHHEINEWSYQGSLGPDHWAGIASQFATCGSGKRQSPIDISKATKASKLPPISWSFPDSPWIAALEPSGLTLAPVDQATFRVDGGSYNMRKITIRIPSEHTRDGLRYALELQIHGQSAAGKNRMVAVLFAEGEPNETLAKVLSRLPTASSDLSEVEPTRVDINPKTWLPKNVNYVAYDGSLSYPPCTEGVSWHVMVGSGEVAAAQIDRLAAALPSNARPLQERHNRKLWQSAR